MVIFNSYVKLPEGNSQNLKNLTAKTWGIPKNVLPIKTT
jgi:hypothetical protein